MKLEVVHAISYVFRSCLLSWSRVKSAVRNVIM